MSFPFESTREIRLTPWEGIRSRMISGKMRQMTGLTQLFDEGEGTRVVYHADSIPGVWIPPLVGKTFIAHEMRDSFSRCAMKSCAGNSCKGRSRKRAVSFSRYIETLCGSNDIKIIDIPEEAKCMVF